MKKYSVYLVCNALNLGKKSVVMANSLPEAKKISLSMYPGYELLNCS